MEKWKKRAIDLLTSMAFGARGDLAVVPFYPQKTRVSGYEERFFHRTTPEKQGVSSKRIYNMYSELEREERSNVHSIMVLRGGEVISECATPGYSVNVWHLSHSMAKSICGMIIGTLVDEGVLSLEKKLIDIFPDIPYRDKKMPFITIEHLLTMTSGVDFAEVGSITDNQWKSAFFSATVKFLPGTRFDYNSMNTYMLACVAEKVSGRSFGELVDSRIFAPLSITNYLWEKSPEGVEKAGWGLFMSAESWGKLGVMMCSGGSFFGKRILSEKWVNLSTEFKVNASGFNERFDYAYHMWVKGRKDEFLFNGMLGQNVWVCPKNDIIVVMFSGNNEIFQDSAALGIIRKHLGGELSDIIDARDYGKLKERERTFYNNRRWVRSLEKKLRFLSFVGLKPRKRFDERWNAVLGRYAFADNNVGMIPLIVRVMQNNFCCSIRNMQITREGEDLYLLYDEGGVEYCLKIGIYEHVSNILKINGEQYLAICGGEVFVLENGDYEYRIEIIFSETASVRRLKITRKEDRICVAFAEMPNERVVENLIYHYSKSNSLLSFGIELIEHRLGDGAIKKLLKERFNPTLVGADMSLCGYECIVEEEQNRMVDESKKNKVILGLVERLLREKNESGGEENKKDSTDSIKKHLFKIVEKIIDITSNKSKNDN